MEKQQAIQLAKELIKSVGGNAKVQADVNRGYSLKPVMRESNNGGTYFNLQVLDAEGKRVGSEVEVGNFNPTRTRAWFGKFENIIIKGIHNIVVNDIVKKMDAANRVDDGMDFEFEVFEAAPKTDAPAPAQAQASVAF